MPKQRLSRGFSLLEMLISLAILSIMASLVAPAYTSLIEQRQIIAVAEAIADDLRWARSESLKSGGDISVFFETKTANIWRYQLMDSTNVIIKTVSNVDNPEFKGVGLTENLREHNTKFNASRGTSEGKNGTISVYSAHANYQLDVVLSNLGRVHICAKSSVIGDYPKCD